MILEERMDKLEIEVVSLKAIVNTTKIQAQCRHNTISVQINDIGEVWRAKCNCCDKVLSQQGLCGARKWSAKRIFRLFK